VDVHAGAAVLDVVHARLGRDASPFFGGDPRLQPDGAGAGGDRLPDHVGGLGRRAEHDDEVDPSRDVLQPAVGALAEDLLGVRIDGDHAETRALQVGRHLVRHLVRLRRAADDRDGAAALEDGAGVSHAAAVPRPPRSRRGSPDRGR
jgi:hypothetical protein